VEDIEVWLGEIEGQLMSEDYGKASSTDWFHFGGFPPLCSSDILLLSRTSPL